MSKKGVSPVVAVVILIALAVAVGGMISSWVTNLVYDSARHDTCGITTMYTMSLAKYNSTSNYISIKVKNAGRVDIYNFTVEVDNGTVIDSVAADSPSDTYILGAGKTQYVIANFTNQNFTSVNTATVLVGSCPSYSPTPINVANI